jgi:hypothetical protein
MNTTKLEVERMIRSTSLKDLLRLVVAAQDMASLPTHRSVAPSAMVSSLPTARPARHA